MLDAGLWAGRGPAGGRGARRRGRGGGGGGVRPPPRPGSATGNQPFLEMAGCPSRRGSLFGLVAEERTGEVAYRAEHAVGGRSRRGGGWRCARDAGESPRSERAADKGGRAPGATRAQGR